VEFGLASWAFCVVPPVVFALTMVEDTVGRASAGQYSHQLTSFSFRWECLPEFDGHG